MRAQMRVKESKEFKVSTDLFFFRYYIKVCTFNEMKTILAEMFVTN